MLRKDGVDAMLTGMIFAAIFVILLVSICRESYVVAGSGAAAETPAAALFFNRLDIGGALEKQTFCGLRRDGEAGLDPGPAAEGGGRFSEITYRDCVLK